jgi:hypothetical protein
VNNTRYHISERVGKFQFNAAVQGWIAGCGLGAIDTPSLSVTREGSTYPLGATEDEIVEFLNSGKLLKILRETDNTNKLIPAAWILVASKRRASTKSHNKFHNVLLSGKFGTITELPWIHNAYHYSPKETQVKAYLWIPKEFEKWIEKPEDTPVAKPEIPLEANAAKRDKVVVIENEQFPYNNLAGNIPKPRAQWRELNKLADPHAKRA